MSSLRSLGRKPKPLNLVESDGNLDDDQALLDYGYGQNNSSDMTVPVEVNLEKKKQRPRRRYSISGRITVRCPEETSPYSARPTVSQEGANSNEKLKSKPRSVSMEASPNNDKSSYHTPRGGTFARFAKGIAKSIKKSGHKNYSPQQQGFLKMESEFSIEDSCDFHIDDNSGKEDLTAPTNPSSSAEISESGNDSTIFDFYPSSDEGIEYPDSSGDSSMEEEKDPPSKHEKSEKKQAKSTSTSRSPSDKKKKSSLVKNSRPRKQGKSTKSHSSSSRTKSNHKSRKSKA